MTGSTGFLAGRHVVWNELRRRSAYTRAPVLAAVAYFGKGGCDLLTLKQGDTLLVDLSLRAVRQGVTDPREIQKLLRKGIRVFSREALHAKFYLMDNVLICGSANVSRRSCTGLDEACIITTSGAAIRQARAHLKSLCTEPVTQEYLNECIKEYRPPRFIAAVMPRDALNNRRSRVWFVGGVSQFDASPKEQVRLDKAIGDAGSELPNGKYEIDWIRYLTKPKFFDDIQPQNWVITAMRQRNGRIVVRAPAQVLRKRTYRSARGSKVHLLVMASPIEKKSISLRAFKSRARPIYPALGSPVARTRPISDERAADRLLRLWKSRLPS